MEKLVYCDAEQKETPHDVVIDKNSETVFTCKNCGRFIKFPKGSSIKEIREGLEAHKMHNDTGKKIRTSEDERLSEKEEESKQKLMRALEKL